MPGGAQLIGDLLQGAFGSDNIDPNQAALAAGYTHVKTTDDDGKPLPKPTYWNPTTGDETDNPVSKLPVKQPGFFQRAFAPNDAYRANSINDSFVASPTIAQSGNRTALNIGGQNAALAAKYRNTPIDQTPPEALGLLTGGNNTTQNLSDVAGQVPQTRTGATIAGLNTQMGIDKATQLQQQVDDYLHNPENRAITESYKNSALQPEYANAGRTAIRSGELGNPELQPTVANSDYRLQLGNNQIGLDTLSARASQARSEANVGSAIAGTQEKYLPSTQRTIANKQLLDEAISRYAGSPPAYALEANPENNTVTAGTTGFPINPTMGAYGPKQTITLSSGTKVAVPSKTTVPVIGDGTQPTIATPRMPMKSNEKNDEETTDEYGNVWKNGHIIMTKEQVEALKPKEDSFLNLSQ